ncbi:fungal pheromone mating factor STE2 GPCR-domain-containing protein [Aspergillus avenaceus]|uniref:Fungal pheromone mating factor STE2 GPCR-domain-containing protein n=1 Tax=Aspergillus avenaceus TaxID=36643 RepID=A0A5N6TEG8_ASPAV|nr:fungal pheromone mating factor STE2 GPCR-domain-containing protein [Aspergillus avenaceus]
MSSVNFDPYTQNLTFRHANGTPFNVTVELLRDDWYQYSLQTCINYAAQLGASIAVFIILMLLTRPEKRGSSVFFLNSGALLLNISRLLCNIIYFRTDFVGPYQWFSGDQSRTPASAYANSILGVVFLTLLIVCIEVSLVLQVQVVCANLRRRYRTILVYVSLLVALTPIGFRMAYMVKNCMTIMKAISPDQLHWLESATNIVLTISICFFSTVFIIKLGLAIYHRRRLGVRDFGPMKVIFIMGCQTLIVPALFSTMQYAVDVPQLASNVITLVTISLPLSSIWAGITLRQSSTRSSTSRGALWDRLALTSSMKSKQTTITSSTAIIDVSNKPSTFCYADQPSGQSQHDLRHGPGISVERDITVHSYHRDEPKV